MATWPLGLPQSPDGDEGSYSEQGPYPVIEAPVDGPAITRRRYTAAPKTYTASFQMSDAQLAVFEEFYETDLAMGAVPFNWKERGIASNPTREFRVIAKPTITHLGGVTWRVTLNLIRLP